MRLWKWLTSWFRTASVVRDLSGSQDRLERVRADAELMRRRLDERAGSLEDLIVEVRTDLESALRTQSRLESALEEVREKNRVLETVIQTLVAANRLLQERWDAETAIAARARVAAAIVRE